jgi:hypothetical protein
MNACGDALLASTAGDLPENGIPIAHSRIAIGSEYSFIYIEFCPLWPGTQARPVLVLRPLRRNANTALGGDRLDLHNVPKFSEAFNQALFLLVG